MNKSFITFFAIVSFVFGYSQSYEFTSIKDIEANPVISQGNTGTCWSFSTTSFLESEIYRITGKFIDLSEMYNVRYTYNKKGWNYVMRQGKAQFSEGGLAHDVINSAKEFGLVPQEVYSGKIDENSKFDHSEMAKELEAIVKKAVESIDKFPNWSSDYDAVLSKYMENPLTTFTVNSKNYTPQTFLVQTKLNLNDYVTITSYTHEPFYKNFILNIPDNFSNGSMYNLPLDEFIFNIDYAINKGFTVALDADVSEKTFFANEGMAVIPENEADVKVIATEIKKEKEISQEFRQQEFENYHTTDDHLMHIVGKVKDQKGNFYYKVKNSWGTTAGKDGFVYMSIPYIKLKAISVLVHKDGLSPKTRNVIKI